MLTGFWHAVSFLGGAAFYLPALIVVFWCVSPRVGARTAVLLAASGALNTMLKLAFQDPRPYWTDPGVTGHESQSSFGMPSGHAQGAMVAYGHPAALSRRRMIWAAAAVVIVLVGISRVHLGVHSIGQVLAGWAIGGVLVVCAVVLEPVVVPWWTRRALPLQMALSLAVALALLGCTALAAESADGPLPATWRRAIVSAGGAVTPVSLEHGALATGILAGVLAGLSLLARRGWFDASGPPLHRIARIGVGAAGLLVVGALPYDHPAAAFAVQALAGLWITAGAPEAFVRLGLAARPGVSDATGQLTRPGDGRPDPGS